MTHSQPRKTVRRGLRYAVSVVSVCRAVSETIPPNVTAAGFGMRRTVQRSPGQTPAAVTMASVRKPASSPIRTPT
jgi:hypothetical protein